MKQNNEIFKWNSIYQNNKVFQNQLKDKNQFEIKEEEFFGNLKIMNNYIYGEYGIGYSKINSITVKKIIELFIEKNKMNYDDYFLITSDGNLECLEIIESIINLNDKNIKFLTFQKFLGFDKTFILSTIKTIKPFGCIYLSKSIFNPEILQIHLYDSNGKEIANEKLEYLVKKMKKNIDDINISQNKNVYFLNNELLIKTFVDKVKQIYSKDLNTNKKTKIMISNRSEGVSNILSKLIGNQEFIYTINNKVKNYDVNIYKYQQFNDKTIKKLFKKELIKAWIKKANLLIIFNKEASQIFLFVLNKNKIIFLNMDLIVLILLNDLYNNFFIDNYNVSNMFISSNDLPNENIKKLMEKYNIHFKQIQNNDFNNLTKNYMLLFWNDYNQIVFGQKSNKEFSIYHLLVKMISIIESYNNQYDSINILLSRLKKMYGEFDSINKYWINKSKENIIKIINNIESNKETNIFNINKKYLEEEEILNFENKIALIQYKNKYLLSIKFNEINNKASISFRKINLNNNPKSKWYYWAEKHEQKKIIKKLFLLEEQ